MENLIKEMDATILEMEQSTRINNLESQAIDEEIRNILETGQWQLRTIFAF